MKRTQPQAANLEPTMKAVSRILMTSLTLALVVPLLSAGLGCSDCEDFCQQEYDECNTGSETDDSRRCQAELNGCLDGCDSEPARDWQSLGK